MRARRNRTNDTKRSSRIPPRGGSALSRRLGERLDETECREALAAALEQLGADGRATLYQRLPERLAQAVAGALKERVPEPPPIDAARLGPAEFRAAWDRLWGAWDAVVAETIDEGGAYVQNAISYNSPDLDQEALAKDLDRAAARLRPLVGRAAREVLVPRFDLARRLVESVARVAQDIASYVIASDEGTTLGPEVTAMALDWLRARAKDADAFATAVRSLRARLADAGLGATLDERAVARFLRTLPAAERKRIEAKVLEPELD